MLLSTASEQYLAYRKAEGFKPNTLRADGVVLVRLMKVLGDMPIEGITPQHIDNVYNHMSEQKLKASTVNLATATMRAFFRWAIERGHRPQERGTPVLGRRYRPIEARSLTRVPLAQFPALLNAARAPRDRMLLALGIYTLARKTEITGIRLSDVDLQGGYISIYVSKSNTYDARPICAELDTEIRQWLVAYQEMVGPLEPDYFLVPAAQGGRQKTNWPLKPRKQMASPEDVVHHALGVLGIDHSHHSGMHVLRRSAARAIFSELSNKGYDGALRQVSAWLNHASTAQTEVYLGLELDRANRDADARGKFLYPSLQAQNVIQLGADHGENRASAM